MPNSRLVPVQHLTNRPTSLSDKSSCSVMRGPTELERLNSCTDEINNLEIKLDEANGLFRLKLLEYTQKLDQMGSKLGKSIDKARPYYITRELARQAQVETQRAAVQYQRAVSTHQAAKETILLAEQRFLSKQEEWEFDAAWQEMVNHATMKVMEAETNKTKSDHEHQKKAARFCEIKQRLQLLEKQLKGVVAKTRPYFELKDMFLKELENLKERVIQLHKAINCAKSSYSESLHNLEMISEEIHAQRKQMQRREPGVGAETELDLPDIVLDKMDEVTKYYKYDECDDDDSTFNDSAIHSSNNLSDVVPSLECDLQMQSTSSGVGCDSNSPLAASTSQHSLCSS